uniref:Uncharacterized protein n=1 Tax=Rhizophora mucronata TaxID=61149 RepID=A0A2P2PWI3_RHIMU
MSSSSNSSVQGGARVRSCWVCKQ